MQIREDVEEYMHSLRRWISDTKSIPLEEMNDFFTARIEGYEAHMSLWDEAYTVFADYLPLHCEKILDLGCGTGLELEAIFRRLPRVHVTGIDMTAEMLKVLKKKYTVQQVHCICGDYFQIPFGENSFDAVISFESLHHFTPEKKQALFNKVFSSLKLGGIFLECDYIACCQEEETLLRDECAARRAAAGVPEDAFVHFDTPLTLEHETQLLQAAGFCEIDAPKTINGATFVKALKK